MISIYVMKVTTFYNNKGTDRWGWHFTTSDASEYLEISFFPSQPKLHKAVSLARKYLRQKMGEKHIVYTPFTGLFGAVALIIKILGSLEDWEWVVEMTSPVLSKDVRDILACADDTDLESSIRKLE